MATKHKKREKQQHMTSDALVILNKKYTEGKPGVQGMLAEARTDIDLADQIHTLRTAAGLTQRALAEKIGTTPSVICRLESADYEGHSLTMLRRIATALDHRLEVSFVPE